MVAIDGIARRNAACARPDTIASACNVQTPNLPRPGIVCIVAILSACATNHEADTGVPVDIVDRRVWFEAVEDGNDEIVRLLIEQGTDTSIEHEGLTALHIAARDGHEGIVEILIESGADVNSGPDDVQMRAASVAGHGSPQMLEMVTGARLSPAEVAHAINLRTPLNLAVESGHIDIARMLIAADADVDAGGEWYRPLHTAVLSGDIEMVALLLDANARINESIRIQDRSRFSGFRYARPLELARIIEREDIVDLLRSNGARD